MTSSRIGSAKTGTLSLAFPFRAGTYFRADRIRRDTGRRDRKSALALRGRSHVPQMQAQHLSGYRASWLGIAVCVAV